MSEEVKNINSTFLNNSSTDSPFLGGLSLFQKLVQWIYLPMQEKLAKDIGCKLLFHHIPDRYIPAIMRCEMTRTWTRAGLDIVKGQNHFTIGKIVSGVSSRFDRGAPEYQSWLGGYTVQLGSDKGWALEDYCELAVADQNSWLKWYGDPSPFTSIKGWKYTEIGEISVGGGYCGTLYEGGFTSHSDVGPNHDTIRFRFASYSLAALCNLANPNLSLTAGSFEPLPSGYPYEEISGRVYLAIFDIKPTIRVVLYGNGLNLTSQFPATDTFKVLKDDFIKAMSLCEIVEI